MDVFVEFVGLGVEFVLAGDEAVERGDGAGEDVDVAQGNDGIVEGSGEVEDAADDDAQHVDFGVEGELADGLELAALGGFEGFGVKAVLEGVAVTARGAGFGLGWHAKVVARKRGNGKDVKRGNFGGKEEMGISG